MASRTASAQRRLAGAALAVGLALLAPTPASAGEAYVSDWQAKSIHPFDVTTNLFAPPITVGSNPRGIAITPDGSTAYVVNQLSNNVTPVNTATGTSGSQIFVGNQPILAAITPDGATLYVTNTTSDSVSKIDTATNTTVATIPVGPGPTGIAITPDGRTAYVARSSVSSVVPLDVATDAVGSAIPTGSNPFGLAITPDGATVYVTNSISDTVTPIDTTTNTAGAPIPAGNQPIHVAISPDGATAYVANGSSSTVTPIDTATNLAGPPIPVGLRPFGIAVTPDGTTAYTTNTFSNDVTPIDTATTIPGTSFAAGSEPMQIAIAPAQPPVAAFAVHAGAPGAATALDASASTDPDGTVARYAWDFGDGETQTTTDPATTHTYAKPGDYTATLTVTDDENCSTTFVFTGQTASCNGKPSARVAQDVIVSAAAAEPPTTPTAEAPIDAIAPSPTHQVVERFALSSRCLATSRSGRARVTMRLRLARPGPVQVRVERALGTRGRAACPKPNPQRRFTGSLRTVDVLKRVPTQAAAASVRRRLTLDLRLEPGLYRIAVRAYTDGGRLTPPVRRWVRVLG